MLSFLIIIGNRFFRSFYIRQFGERRIQAFPFCSGINHFTILQVHLDPGQGDARSIVTDVGLGLEVEVLKFLVGRYSKEVSDILSSIRSPDRGC